MCKTLIPLHRVPAQTKKYPGMYSIFLIDSSLKWFEYRDGFSQCLKRQIECTRDDGLSNIRASSGYEVGLAHG